MNVQKGGMSAQTEGFTLVGTETYGYLCDFYLITIGTLQLESIYYEAWKRNFLGH